MTRNRHRHRRAYVAGARQGIARLREVIAPLIPAEARAQFNARVDAVTAEFPMPPIWRQAKAAAQVDLDDRISF
ncbi:hypothetical protein ACFSKM_12655 [Ancylobacter dichloromethanicus]|uniref:Uncharacterized protein n=2 Tax=Ancylobacter dichloromethanicus TaxID=518825 RepID=A0A9W6J9S2_9HYPH|nr:hypothetical protein GCM10017643_17930 [Ancylobacter dichloromethanicus]